MAPRQIKMPDKGEQMKLPEKSEVELAPATFSQAKKPEAGRFLLQVDRQTKGAYQTAEAAHAAGLVIKKGYPVVHVSVYDTVETQNTTVALPPA